MLSTFIIFIDNSPLIVMDRCLTLMNDFSLDHVGLEKYKLTAIKESVCMNICSTQKFDIAIFIVPCGWSMPLHDHPNMAVLSKLLHGEALCTSYTPLYSCKTNNSERVISNSPNSESSSLATGSFHMRAVETKNVQCPAWYLTPNQDNIHSIHAMSSCKGDSAEPAVLLDVLLPPYDSISRPCSYYTATPQPMWQPTVPVGLKTNTSGTSQIIEEWKWKKWIIEECDEPTDLLPYGVEYTGETPVK